MAWCQAIIKTNNDFLFITLQGIQFSEKYQTNQFYIAEIAY